MIEESYSMIVGNSHCDMNLEHKHSQSPRNLRAKQSDDVGCCSWNSSNISHSGASPFDSDELESLDRRQSEIK